MLDMDTLKTLRYQ